jgi:hypothetical protein
MVVAIAEEANKVNDSGNNIDTIWKTAAYGQEKTELWMSIVCKSIRI